MPYETIIGLEVHAQLKTQSKMFCGCANKFGDPPNTNICPVCTGQPGVLPAINKKAVEFAIKTALALKCKINESSVFARKNYFYPDLPKNFQISQFELPLAEHGYLNIEVNNQKNKIGITRVHLEEDAGKLVHKGAARIMGSDYSLADYNRAGTPLMEIVSDPDIRSPEEAKAYMETLAHLLEYIGVCDAKMEEGSLRCDANISIRRKGETNFGTKTEVKNMNSFKAVMKALQAEEKRHNEMAKNGEKIIQETRFYDDETETTTGMRSKEYSHDYRYFPEPDLVPIEPEKAWVESIRETLGELPEQKKERYMKTFKLSAFDAGMLVSSPYLSHFFEETISIHNNPKSAANWLMGDIAAHLKANKIELEKSNITPSKLAEMVSLIDKGAISNKIGKEVVVETLNSGKSVQDIIKEKGLIQISDESELIKIIRDVVKNNPKQALEYKAGKETIIMFFIGQVMKASAGRANPDIAQKLLKQELRK